MVILFAKPSVEIHLMTAKTNKTRHQTLVKAKIYGIRDKYS